MTVDKLHSSRTLKSIVQLIGKSLVFITVFKYAFKAYLNMKVIMKQTISLINQ